MNLMLDECVHDPDILKALNQDKKFNAAPSCDCGFQGRRADRDLVYQTQVNRILVSKNIKDMNEVQYPPCGHRGLIAFHKQELTADYVLTRLRALHALQLDTKVKKHVTKIYDDRIEVHTLEERIDKVFKDYAQTKHIT